MGIGQAVGTATVMPRALNYAARARWTRVHIETETDHYEGKVCVPESKRRVSDVLCDARAFLMVTDVRNRDRSIVEPVLAIHKAAIRTIRILEEEAEAPSAA